MRLKIHSFVLLFGLLLPTARGNANVINLTDGYSHINIKVGSVQGVPRGNTIEASINGNTLSIVFLQNIGLLQRIIQKLIQMYFIIVDTVYGKELVVKQ